MGEGGKGGRGGGGEGGKGMGRVESIEIFNSLHDISCSNSLHQTI